ncbi:MAG: C-terminal helicase domain-containing protein, partial [Candidatus Aminicenantes bacterium]|nr:C-terminal helicase domain-containing protein [Candidatus Aminicenantes bacterium]
EKVARMLRSKGIDALPYHAGLKNEEREKIQDKFMAGEIPVIAATIAFGMGIDKRDIRRIIHYNLPKSLESYSQEIGRAGRDGQPSLCETLADRDSISILENFVYGDTPEEAGVKIALEAIRANQGNLWEVKLRTLSTESDIRQLPLKTLLVYLELEKIIKPRYTYFQDYEFKFITGQDEIIARLKEFRKEISEFAGVIFKHIFTKKIWSTVDIDAVVKEQSAPRERVIKALEYFGEQGWIELRSKIAIDVYEIMNHDFDIETLSAKLLTVFEKKETTEIERIHKMVAFFAGKSCLSAALSGYFGELGIKNCGRCSVCKTGPVVIPPGEQREPLTSYNYNELAKEFTSAISEELSPATIAKFFCGISSPLLTRNKAKKIRNFGILEDYPFKEVKKWVHKQGDF